MKQTFLNDKEVKDLEINMEDLKRRRESQLSMGLVPSDRMVEQLESGTKRLDELKNELFEIDSNTNRKISPADVSEMLKRLGHKANKNEIEEMIWEVDEDLDMMLEWREFKLMFHRNTLGNYNDDDDDTNTNTLNSVTLVDNDIIKR